MRFTYNQYNHNYYESGYRIPSKMHNNNNATTTVYPHYYKSNFGMRMTMSTASTMSSRLHRKGFRIPNKRHPGKAIPSKLHSINRPIAGKLVPGKRIPQRPHPPHCDNSNDSGLGFDQHVDQASNASNNNNTHNINLNHSGSSGSSSSSSSGNSSASSSTSTNLNLNTATVNATTLQAANHQQRQQQDQLQQQQEQLQQQHSQHNSHLQQQQQHQPHHHSLQHHHHSHHNHHHHHHHQLHQQGQHTKTTTAGSGSLHQSPQQQHLIRAIPSSSKAIRSTPAKKLSFYDNDNETHDEDEDDFLSTDDSDANTSNSMYTYAPASAHYGGGQRGQKAIKRKILETHVDLDNDDACSEDAFMHKIANEHVQQQQQAQLATVNAMQATIQQTANSGAAAVTAATVTPPTKFISAGKRGLVRVANKRQPAVPQNSIAASQNGQVQLEIILQPEQQHRARYQTEGSRGAVKDRSGNGFPIVRLTGYNKPTVLQVFIGTDVGRVAPHMFYQACKVAGKNSTQCNERKVDGTMVIEIDFKPESEMTVTCDCVGILKERNVDVEHRFPDHLAQKNKKKSTRCRMVFRTEITHDDGTTETLQVCSNPIICTQPPGVPEICKKSLNSCPVDGGLELFIIGKNFLKDTQVIFQETYDDATATTQDLTMQQQQAQQLLNGDTTAAATAATTLWEQTVLPDKEYLQQTHLICTVPPYIHQNIMKPITVQVSIISSGKKSESHSFVYTPKGSYTKLAAATALSTPFNGSGSLSAAQDASAYMDASSLVPAQEPLSTGLWPTAGPAAAASGGLVAETKHEIDSGMMPPPITTQIPMGVRRPSLNTATPMITEQQLAHLNAVAAVEVLKTELLDDSSQSSLAEAAAIHSPDALSPHSPTALQYRSRYGRKQSMDAMMYDSNSMPGYPVAATSTATAQMEAAAVAAAMEIAVKNEMLHAAAVQQQQHQQQQQQQQETQASVLAAATVDKFFTDIAKSSAVVSNVVPEPNAAAAAAAAAALFDVNVATNNIVAATAAAIDHALNDILQQDAVLGAQPQSVLERSLSISSNSSSSNASNVSSPMSTLNAACTSPSGSLTAHNSPHAQDIILNSEPAATLNTLPMQQLMAGAHGTNVTGELTVATTANPANVTAAGANSLSTDIIMNAAVSPSTLLCSANGAARAVVPNIMAPHQVTMANSILNDIAMQPQPTQQDAAVAALALTNIIMSPTSATDVLPAAPTGAVQPVVTTATSTAVSNMIIKAAADFISNQEQQTQHHHQQLHQQQQQLHHQHHAHHQQEQQHQQQQQSQQSQSPTQQVQQQQLLPTTPGVVSPNGTDPLVNLLLNHAPVAQAAVAAAVNADVPTPFPLGIAPTAPSESLIVALATEHALQKSAAAVTTSGAIVTQQTTAATGPTDLLPSATGVVVPAVDVGVSVGTATAAVALPPPIPQELTTMSDQDLISYINPSTFDQL